MSAAAPVHGGVGGPRRVALREHRRAGAGALARVLRRAALAREPATRRSPWLARARRFSGRGRDRSGRVRHGSGSAHPARAASAALEAAAPATGTFVAGRDYEVLSCGHERCRHGKDPVTEFFHVPLLSLLLVRARARALGRGRTRLRGADARIPVFLSADRPTCMRALSTRPRCSASSMRCTPLSTTRSTRAAIAWTRERRSRAFFARFDVDSATFAGTFDSSAVDARVRRAIALSHEYGIRATPSLVVAGRYSTNPAFAGTHVLAVVDHLVAEEAEQGVRRCAAGADQPSPYCDWRNNR